MSEPQEHVNIFLTTTAQKDKVLAGATPQENYIILMNDTLQAEQRTLTKQIQELEVTIDELETDNDRMEKGRTYMKGLLKNFNELGKYRKEVIQNQDKLLETIPKDLKLFKHRATKHLRILQSILIGFMGVWYETHFLLDFVSIFAVLVLIVAFQESTLWNVPMPKIQNNITNIKKEIIELEKGQDYIHELVDQL